MGATKPRRNEGCAARILVLGLLGLAVGVGLGACRAEVGVADGGDEVDLAGGGDGPIVDLAPPADLVGADLTCAAASGPEQCANGCDDDGNGLVDADDPACTPQVIPTAQNPPAGTPLYRLLLGAGPEYKLLDENDIRPAAFAVRVRAFDPAVFIAREGNSRLLQKLTLSPTGTGTLTDYPLAFAARDVCVFGSDLIVLERGSSAAFPSRIHRFGPDGVERGTSISLGATLVTACASDGTRLYVATHDLLGAPSEFRVFDASYAQVSTLNLPAGLKAWERTAETLDRCLDFAWTPTGGWYGLFVDAGGSLNDALLSGDRLFRFDFDGGVPAALDAGLLHGIGDFR
jgi:hypothetical protein